MLRGGACAANGFAMDRSLDGCCGCQNGNANKSTSNARNGTSDASKALVMLIRHSVRGTRNAMFEWCNLRGKRLLDELVEVAAK